MADLTRKFKAEGISLSEGMEKHLLKIKGVKKINIDYETEEVQVIYDINEITFKNIKQAIESQGYVIEDIPEKTLVEPIKRRSKAKINSADEELVTTQAEPVIRRSRAKSNAADEPVITQAEQVKRSSKAKSNAAVDDPVTTHAEPVKRSSRAKSKAADEEPVITQADPVKRRSEVKRKSVEDEPVTIHSEQVNRISKAKRDISEDEPVTAQAANVTKKFLAKGIGLSEDIENDIRSINGVKKIDIDYETEEVLITYDPNKTNFDRIKEVIESQGYICEDNTETTQVEQVKRRSRAKNIVDPDEPVTKQVEQVKRISRAKSKAVDDEPVKTPVEQVKRRSKAKSDISEDEPVTAQAVNVTKTFKAKGIGLSEDIENDIRSITGVKKIDIDYETEEVLITYDTNKTNFDSVRKAIESQGYICEEDPATAKVEKVLWAGPPIARRPSGSGTIHAEKVLWEGPLIARRPGSEATHAEKVIWKGPNAGSLLPDHGTIHIETVKRRPKAKDAKGRTDPETAHVENVTKKFKATGMTCKNCERIIEKQVKSMPGVKKINIDYATEEVQVIFDPHKTNFDNIKNAIELKGYICEENTGSKKMTTSGWILLVLGIIVVGYFAIQSLETIELPKISQDMSYGLLFIVGLLTGLHCVSMCGGFVVSYSTKGIKEGKKPHELHLAYGLGKTISYTIIGAVFGLLGSIIAFTPMMRGVAGILAGLFLLLFGLKMLNIFPVLRNIQLKTPEFISKFTYGQKKKHSDPLTIGLLNGLMIACGPLQAIYIMAAGTGSMIEGAKLLFVFALGTLPVMLSFGYITSFIGSKATHQILKFSGAMVIILGIFMINNGLALAGIGFDIKPADATPAIDNAPGSQQLVDANSDYQEIRMDVTRAGYVPNTFTLKKGVPVKWIINGKELTGCNNAIQVPSLGLEFDIKKGEQVIEFTPDKAGTIRWSCWMGMIQGSFIVK